MLLVNVLKVLNFLTNSQKNSANDLIGKSFSLYIDGFSNSITNLDETCSKIYLVNILRGTNIVLT